MTRASNIRNADPAPVHAVLGQEEPATTSEMIWADWPRDLPSPRVVRHAAGVFFDKIATLPKMLQKSTFMAQLQLPPTHYAFPVSLESLLVMV